MSKLRLYEVTGVRLCYASGAEHIFEDARDFDISTCGALWIKRPQKTILAPGHWSAVELVIDLETL